MTGTRLDLNVVVINARSRPHYSKEHLVARKVSKAMALVYYSRQYQLSRLDQIWVSEESLAKQQRRQKGIN